MAIDFPRSTYTAAEGVSAEGWPASPSNGDTETNGAGDNFTFNGTSSLWVLDTGRTLTLSGGATYSWDGEKWIAQSHIPFRYFGPQSTDPTGLTADNEGDLYFNTVENEMRVYNGSSWDTITSVGNFNILTLSQSSGSGGGSATFNGTATRFQLSETPNVAQQLLISINGVVQEPQAGTSPTEGFAVDGNDIIFASAPATGSTFFGVQMGAAVNIGTPTDGSVTNVHVNASAAIAGSKISPDFGSQDIVTTGEIGIGTTSPAASLDIDDSGASAGTKSLKLNIVDNTAETVHIAQGSNEYLSIDTSNSTELITIGNTTTKPDVIVPDGKVGIGTTTPLGGSKLTVASGCIAVTGQNTEHSANSLRIGEEGSGVAQLRAYGPNTSTRGSIRFDVSRSDGLSTQTLILDNAGNVGIGTTAPADKLHVSGTAETNFRLTGSSATVGCYLMLQNLNTGNASATAIQGLDASGQGITEIKSQSTGDANNEGYLTFSTRQASQSMAARMRITSDGDVRIGDLPTQNVGATNGLQIGHTGTPQQRFVRNDNTMGDGDVIGEISCYTNAAQGAQTYNRSGSIKFKAADTLTTNNRATKISFEVGPNNTNNEAPIERFVILPNGNVEITNGDLVLNSGKGIDFGDTNNITGTSSEILDDYEEGSWTPGTTNITNSGAVNRLRHYIKVGKQVTVWGDIFQTNNNMSISNSSTITGFPFATSNSNFSGRNHVTCSVMAFKPNDGSSSVMLPAYMENTTLNLKGGAVSGIRHLWFTITYEVA